MAGHRSKFLTLNDGKNKENQRGENGRLPARQKFSTKTIYMIGGLLNNAYRFLPGFEYSTEYV